MLRSLIFSTLLLTCAARAEFTRHYDSGKKMINGFSHGYYVYITEEFDSGRQILSVTLRGQTQRTYNLTSWMDLGRSQCRGDGFPEAVISILHEADVKVPACARN